MSPNASHRVRPGLSSAASLITTLLISFDQEVLNQHLNLVTPEYPFFESPCGRAGRTASQPCFVPAMIPAPRGPNSHLWHPAMKKSQPRSDKTTSSMPK